MSPLPEPSDVFLDLRGLFPPEPMERVLDALSALQPRQRVRLLIEREPHPLFRILERNHYLYLTTQPEPGLYQVIIEER